MMKVSLILQYSCHYSHTLLLSTITCITSLRGSANSQAYIQDDKYLYSLYLRLLLGFLADLTVQWSNDTYVFSESVEGNASTTLETSARIEVEVSVFGMPVEITIRTGSRFIFHPSAVPRDPAAIQVVNFRGSLYKVAAIRSKFMNYMYSMRKFVAFYINSDVV